jgi:hypothetical protein
MPARSGELMGQKAAEKREREREKKEILVLFAWL